MKQVSFLLTPGVLKPSSLFGAIEIFQKANEFYINKGAAAYYDIQIVGADLCQDLLNTSLFIRDLKSITSVHKTDCIIIPGMDTEGDFAIQKSSEAIGWLIEQYKEGAEIASLCTGTFLLAATGLLKGAQCSTHWMAEAAFKHLFPDVTLCTNRIVTDHKGLYTAGGAASCLNLGLYLIEKYNGREVALYCAKVLQIDIDRASQSPFMIFQGMKDHPDEEIKTVQQYIENNIEEKITVDALADQCAMNRVSFSRRFKKATLHSPIDYIQKVKMEAAKRSLESSRKNINEVMYAVGYADVKAFRTIFKKVAGITPWEYKMKFGKS